MKSSKFKSQISKWASILSVCLLLVVFAAPVFSARQIVRAQDDAQPKSTTDDPTSAQREMRHLFPASVKDIREACPGVSCEFILQQIEASATIFEAQAAYQKIQAIEIERLKAERSTLTAKMISQIRDVCPGASDQFILKLVESGATIDDARNAYEKLRLTEIDRLRSENAQLVADKLKLRRQAVTVAAKVPPMALQGRVLSGGDEGIARIKIDKQIYRIRQGQQLAITTEGVLMKIVAEEISAGAVRLHLMPQNVRMEL